MTYAFKTGLVYFPTKWLKSLLMKRDATELKNRLLHFPLIKHHAKTTFTANRFPNALAKNGFRLKSNQPQFTKGKGKAEPFTQSMKRLHRNTKTYKLFANMHMSYNKCFQANICSLMLHIMKTMCWESTKILENQILELKGLGRKAITKRDYIGQAYFPE